MDCPEPASMHYVIPLRLYGDSADAFSHDLMVPACAPLKALIALDFAGLRSSKLRTYFHGLCDLPTLELTGF